MEARGLHYESSAGNSHYFATVRRKMIPILKLKRNVKYFSKNTTILRIQTITLSTGMILGNNGMIMMLGNLRMNVS